MNKYYKRMDIALEQLIKKGGYYHGQFYTSGDISDLLIKILAVDQAHDFIDCLNQRLHRMIDVGYFDNNYFIKNKYFTFEDIVRWSFISDLLTRVDIIENRKKL